MRIVGLIGLSVVLLFMTRRLLPQIIMVHNPHERDGGTIDQTLSGSKPSDDLENQQLADSTLSSPIWRQLPVWLGWYSDFRTFDFFTNLNNTIRWQD